LGGAIRNQLNAEGACILVKNSSFEGNVANQGGAMFFSSGNLTVDSCNFTGNIANNSIGSDIFFLHRFDYFTELIILHSHFSEFYHSSLQANCFTSKLQSL